MKPANLRPLPYFTERQRPGASQDQATLQFFKGADLCVLLKKNQNHW
jgi:hypothetical protein